MLGPCSTGLTVLCRLLQCGDAGRLRTVFCLQQGFWLSMLATQCAQAPNEQRRYHLCGGSRHCGAYHLSALFVRLLCFPVRALYFPLALVGFFALLGGITYDTLLAVGVGYLRTSIYLSTSSGCLRLPSLTSCSSIRWIRLLGCRCSQRRHTYLLGVWPHVFFGQHSGGCPFLLKPLWPGLFHLCACLLTCACCVADIHCC